MATPAYSSAVRRGKSKYVESPGRKRRYQGRYSHPIQPPSRTLSASLDLTEAEPPPQVQAQAPAPEAQKEEGSGEDELTRNPRLERWTLLVEKRRVRQFFRLCAVVNVLSLTCSGPFMRCEEPGYNCSAQFVTITCVDFVLSVLFTVQLVARLQYAWWQHTTAKKAPAPPTLSAIQGGQRYKEQTSTTCTRLLLLGLVTFSLWWSVAIGIYRSLVPVIPPEFYLLFVFRSLSIFSAAKLIVRFPYSAWKGIFRTIKWKQLGYVALFYLFFLYVFALLGVQWIGGLSSRCVIQDTATNRTILAIPVTHCNNATNSGPPYSSCYSTENPSLQCENFPVDSQPLNIDYRNSLYFGQFRVIVDAIFAVYEASSLELWTAMQYAAIEGAERSRIVIGLYFLTLVMFLVILVQQSIFLVVIIESFADLRSQTAIGRAPPQRQRGQPSFVLSSSHENSRLQLQAKRAKRSSDFDRLLRKYYYSKVEKVFLVLVFVDVVIYALKHTGMSDDLALAMQIWQYIASSLFFLEAIGVCVFHLFNDQWRPLLTSAYFWYLTVLAVAGIVSVAFYDPLQPSTDFKVVIPLIQSLRLPRLLRLFPAVKKFFLKILGDGTRLLVVILMTLVFLVWFALINMQLFGYLQPASGCGRVGNHFGGFFNALEAMFQVVMQEGWTELMSELVCHQPYWLPVMLYFVLLHLIASLILLNFFVAVILDNLEYPEEKKQRKLEQEQQPKRETVPFHLRVFRFCRPKCVPAPKLSSVDAPSLTECDVRRFYEVGEAKILSPCVPSSHSATSTPNTSYQLRRQSTLSSQSSQFDQPEFFLLNQGSSNLITNSGPTNQGKYHGIQSILSDVKAFRKCTREQENSIHPRHDSFGNRATLERGTNGQRAASSSRLIQSEYDEYREKYHLFDNALFFMPPKHWLRSFCRAVLSAQLTAPQTNPSFQSRPNQLWVIVRNRVAYITRYTVSRLPYFTWLMLALTCFSLCIMIYEYQTSPLLQDNFKPYPAYIWPADLIFILFTLLELVLKILAHGFFMNPNAAIKSIWDVLDWFIVFATFATMITYLVSCGPAAHVEVGLRHLNAGFMLALCLRALRPLRLVSLVPNMRRVVWDVVLGWKKFLLGSILLVSFILMFASLGVQLFSAKNPADSLLGFCNDFNMGPKECVGEFEINVLTTGRELLPTDDIRPTKILVPRVWYGQRRDFSFSNTLQAFLTLFEVLTLEGWLDIRDMLKDEREETTWYLKIYLHLFVFVGVNLGLQLFVGIVVNNFNEHKPGHSALLSVSQKRWTDLMQSLSLTRPIKLPPHPANSRFRQLLYRLVVSKYYRIFITVVILFHSFTFVVPWVNSLDSGIEILVVFSILFSLYYILELCLKLLAFGPLGYFHSWRNLFDCLLALLTVSYIVCVCVVLSTHNTSTQLLRSVTDLGLVLAVFKLFTLLGKYRTLQDLTVTVVQTLFKSTSLLGVLVAFVLSYIFIGYILFGNVRTGEAINYSFVNFADILSTASLSLRIMTGEDWHHILRDTMVREPYCSEWTGDCGNRLGAILWFISYYIIVTFIFINVFIAVLLENFSIFYSKGETRLDHAVVKDFQQNWYFFDKGARGSIPGSQIKLLLRMLRLQELYTYQTKDSGPRERHLSNALVDPLLLREMVEELKRVSKPATEFSTNGTELVAGNEEEEEGGKEEEKEWHSFQNVLRMLAYRAENIYTRLEPQELYERGEMEEGVQFEVAEDCILNWMRRFVKPVLQMQKRKEQLRKHTVYEPRRSRVKLLDIWDPPTSQPPQTPWVSQETEDDHELDVGHTPRLVQSFSSLSDAEQANEGTLEHPLLQRSYARLAQAPVLYSNGLGKEDKWHEWFRTQRDWMNNLDKEDYFDDGI